MTKNKIFKKFKNQKITAKGEPRGMVPFNQLKTLWLNTGTLCNLECTNCYIKSSPKNDGLQYLTRADILPFLEEVKTQNHPIEIIGLTGGEPFINPHIFEILEEILKRGHSVLVLTNGYRVLERNKKKLLYFQEQFGKKLNIRVSLDHYKKEIHEKERGTGTFLRTIEGIKWLYDNNFSWTIAGRSLVNENPETVKKKYNKLFESYNINYSKEGNNLIIFPEMKLEEDQPEISESCWNILKVSKEDQMCATSRMIIHRKGRPNPEVQACTLLATQKDFSMGQSLKESFQPVYLNHPFCSKFCILGGASCSN